MTTVPDHTLYEILKDFQPALAALIALTAAIFAYRSAMLKIEHDKRTAEIEEAKQKLSLYLRLRAEIINTRHFARQAVKSSAVVRDALATRTSPSITVWLKQFEPDVLGEAWQKLHLFPPDVARRIESLRIAQRGVMTMSSEGMGSALKEEENALDVSFAALVSVIDMLEPELTGLIESTKIM